MKGLSPFLKSMGLYNKLYLEKERNNKDGIKIFAMCNWIHMSCIH